MLCLVRLGTGEGTAESTAERVAGAGEEAEARAEEISREKVTQPEIWAGERDVL